MGNNSRVLNVSRGFSLKHKQALRAVENCACAWVEFGVTIRDLTLAESITARNEQARVSEPLCSSELPGLRYEAPETKLHADFWQKRSDLLKQAGAFASGL